jgi:hypothetical protein
VGIRHDVEEKYKIAAIYKENRALYSPYFYNSNLFLAIRCFIPELLSNAKLANINTRNTGHLLRVTFGDVEANKTK